MDMELVKRFVALGRKIRAMEAEVADLKAEREQLKQPLMDMMIEEGMVNTTVELDGESSTVFIHSNLYVSRADGVEPGDIVTAFEQAGLGEMVSHTVQSTRLSAWAKELGEAAAEQGVTREDLVPAPLRGKITFAIDNDVRMRASSRRAATQPNE